VLLHSLRSPRSCDDIAQGTEKSRSRIVPEFAGGFGQLGQGSLGVAGGFAAVRRRMVDAGEGSRGRATTVLVIGQWRMAASSALQDGDSVIRRSHRDDPRRLRRGIFRNPRPRRPSANMAAALEKARALAAITDVSAMRTAVRGPNFQGGGIPLMRDAARRFSRTDRRSSARPDDAPGRTLDLRPELAQCDKSADAAVMVGEARDEATTAAMSARNCGGAAGCAAARSLRAAPMSRNCRRRNSFSKCRRFSPPPTPLPRRLPRLPADHLSRPGRHRSDPGIVPLLSLAVSGGGPIGARIPPLDYCQGG